MIGLVCMDEPTIHGPHGTSGRADISGSGKSRLGPGCVLTALIVTVLIAVAVIIDRCRPRPTIETEPPPAEPGIVGGAFEDVIETPYAANEVVALIDGLRSTCLNDVPSGPFFNNSVGLGNFTGGCGGRPPYAVLFSKDRRVRFVDPGWTTSFDKITEVATTAAAGADDRAVVKLRVWKGVMHPEPGSSLQLSASTFIDVIDTDLKAVNGLFNDNRTGLRFEFEPAEVVDLGENLDAGDYWTWCKEILQASPPSFEGKNLDPQLIDVIFVAGGAMSGLMCNHPLDGWPDGVILMNYFKRYDATALAHELGHALGLMGSVGHVVSTDSAYAGFDAYNVMRPDWPPWPGSAVSLAARKSLTLGQSYRMNAADNSWFVMTQSPPPAWKVSCQDEHYKDAPCPHLRQDLVELAP